MITGPVKSQIDQIWNASSSGSISNPLEVIEQITYLLFPKRLDDLDTLEEDERARRAERAVPHPASRVTFSINGGADGAEAGRRHLRSGVRDRKFPGGCGYTDEQFGDPPPYPMPASEHVSRSGMTGPFISRGYLNKPSQVDYDAKVLLQQPVIVEAGYAGVSTMKLKHPKLFE